MLGIIIVFAFAALAIVWNTRRRARQDRSNRSQLQLNRRGGIKTPASLHPNIDLQKCMGCASCVQACPEQNVLGLIEMQAALLRPDHCVGHGKCESACPVGAITLVLGASDNGVEIPVTDEFFQTRVPGVYVVGELGGIGLIRNSMLHGLQCIEAIAAHARRREVDYDVIIVGAGPAGLGATLQAAAKKLRYLTLEQEDIGGTVMKYPRRKVVMTAPLHLPGYGKIHFRDVSKEDLLREWRKIIAHTGVHIQTHMRVDKVLRRNGFFEVWSASRHYTTSHVVLALGRRGTPRKLEVPGETLTKVLYQLDDPHQFAGRNCLVVGGGDSALECALMLAKAGGQVSFSYRQKAFTRAKPRNRQMFEDAMRGHKIRAYLPSLVREITATAARLDCEGVEHVIPNDNVFILIGGVLPFDFLKKIGIEMRTLYGEPLHGQKSQRQRAAAEPSFH